MLRGESYLKSRRGAGSFAGFPSEPEPVTAGLPYLGEADEGVIDLTVAAPTALAETFLEAAGVALERLPVHLRGDGYACSGCRSSATRWPRSTGGSASPPPSSR